MKGEGEDKEQLLKETRALKKQIRKAETSLWEKKEDDCKKGRRKLGSKLITSKEEYLRALVEKGIRRELRRSEKIRDYWARRQGQGQELGEKERAAIEQEIELEELDTETETETQGKEGLEQETEIEELELELECEAPLEEKVDQEVEREEGDLEVNPKEPEIQESAGEIKDEEAPGPDLGVPVSSQHITVSELGLLTVGLNLEGAHLLEPLPASPSLLLAASSTLLPLPPEQENQGLLVQPQQEVPEQEARQESGLLLRGRLYLKRAQQVVYSCITCLVQCLGPV